MYRAYGWCETLHSCWKPKNTKYRRGPWGTKTWQNANTLNCFTLKSFFSFPFCFHFVIWSLFASFFLVLNHFICHSVVLSSSFLLSSFSPFIRPLFHSLSCLHWLIFFFSSFILFNCFTFLSLSPSPPPLSLSLSPSFSPSPSHLSLSLPPLSLPFSVYKINYNTDPFFPFTRLYFLLLCLLSFTL